MPSQKETLYLTCKAQLTEKIAELQRMVATIDEARNNETKSSAGDKYETGRAMMQMERDKVTARLEQARHTLSQLNQIAIDNPPVPVKLGSLITTDQRTYFLAVSLGKVMVDNQPYFCLSPDSPVGKLLMGKNVGDTITFNQRQEVILEIT